VEISVTVQQRRTPALEVELNEPFLTALGDALDLAHKRGYVAGPLAPSDLVRFPQALTIRERTEAEGTDERLAGMVASAVAAALGDLDAMRTTEGGFLRTDLEARRTALGGMFERLERASHRGLDGLRARLEERVRELRADSLAEESLIAQEIAK